MAPKRKARREYGTGSVYQNDNGTYTAALRINGRLVRRTAHSREGAEATIAELLTQRHDMTRHVPKLEGLQFMIELWWQRLPVDLQERYRTMLDARILPVIEDLKKLDAQHVDVAQHAQLFSTWINTWFNEAITARMIKPKTQVFYSGLMALYLIPALGDKRLYEVHATDVQKLITGVRADIASEGFFSGIRTARAVYGVLRDAFKVAVERGYLFRHPCDGVRIPSPDTYVPIPLTDAELRRFLVVANQGRHAVLFHIYALMGLRLAEGMGLSWANVDWDAQTIRLEHQVQYIDGKLQLTGLKTAASYRTLPLPALVFRGLRDLWEHLDQKNLGTIFLNQNGGLLHPHSIHYTFDTICARAGIAETVTPHHLRHTHSTLLDETGASEVIKKGLLGHGKKGTSQLYTHARIEQMRKATRAVEERLFGAILQTATQ